MFPIVRGDRTRQRRVDESMARKQATDDDIRSAAGSRSSVAGELTKLGQLHNAATLTGEYQQQKAKSKGPGWTAAATAGEEEPWVR